MFEKNNNTMSKANYSINIGRKKVAKNLSLSKANFLCITKFGGTGAIIVKE